MRFLTGVIVILIIGLLYSCEGHNNNPSVIQNEKSENHNYSYDGADIYLGDLGVTCHIPSQFNFLDTNELNQIIDSLDHIKSPIRVLSDFYLGIKENKLSNSYFQDTTFLMNCILFSGFRKEIIDETFLSDADSILIYSFENLELMKMVQVTKIENTLVKGSNSSYGKITHSYSFQGLKWYVFYYFIPGENMLLNVMIRSVHLNGMDEMIENLQLDY